ncbi:MAG: XRE family transcriptional regulator [Anaerolineaceae bacterium]|nr:MAG: XRE family transcriptional regulator [Anaerolineaceae bacterium]
MPNDTHPGRLHGRMARRHRRWQDSLLAMMEPATDQPDAAEIDVGSRLRELRTAQGLSIRSLAEMSGLNFNTLSLIENSKTSPSVSTLQQLALALNVSITAFFERVQAPKQVVFQKSGQRPRASFAYGLLEDLGDGMTLQGGQPLLVTMKPGADSGPDPIVHTGHEFVYCLDGCLSYRVGGEEYLLETGDSLLFEAHLPHCWRNLGETISRSLLILCPADENDTSAEQHFAAEQESQ